MKKTLFVKFLFLLLCGSVLTTAGCKDYDDDIDALRNDVEDLKGTVVELNGFENRIAALEQTQAAFEAIDFPDLRKRAIFLRCKPRSKDVSKTAIWLRRSSQRSNLHSPTGPCRRA